MKSTSRKCCIAALVIAMSQLAAAQNASQENVPKERVSLQWTTSQSINLLEPLTTLESIRSSNAGLPTTVSGGEAGAAMMGENMIPSGRQLLLQQINHLRQMLNAPDQDRKELEVLLREALAEYFVVDMEERVRELDKIKSRVALMESKLQTRLDRRYEVVELQIKQMLHKADGLDFFVPEQAAREGGMDRMMGSTLGGMGSGAMMSGGGSAMMAGGSMGDAMMSDMGDGSAAGSGAGNAELNPVPGYDVGFAMTRYLRFPGKPLKANDPLKIYEALDAKTDRANDWSKVRPESSDEEKLKYLLLAMHNFESIFRHFPAPASRRSRSEKPHSWRVALLPILGQAELYKQYRFDESWDSENNLKLVEKMPAIFCSKVDPNPKNGKTAFQMLVGNGAAFDANRPTEMRDVTDGTSNTIALVLASSNVIWTKPDDVQFVPNATLSNIAPSRLIGMCDGSVRKVPLWGEQQLTIFATRAGGEYSTE